MADLNNPQRLPRPILHRHLSLKRDDDPKPYIRAIVQDGSGQWVSTTATQGSIDQMEQSRIMLMLAFFREARTWVGGMKVVNKWVNVSSGFSHIFRDLNPVYRMDRLDDGEGGTWTTDADGKMYGIPNYSMEDGQKLCLNKDNFAKVAALGVEWRDFFDVRIAGTKVVVGADFTLPPEPAKYDKAITRAAPITADHPMRPLTADQLAKLNAATTAHQHGSDPHEHPDEEASHRSVQELLKVFEDSARDEEERHFFSLMQFNGGKDSRWTHEDGHLIGKLEDVTWNFWDEELRKPAPNWGLSHYWEIAHQQAHALYALNTIANPKDVQMLYRFPCLDQNGNGKRIAECPEENQAQVMKRMRAGVLLQGMEPIEVDA